MRSSFSSYSWSVAVTVHDWLCVMQAQIVMSDQYTYTNVLGSARQPQDILYIPGIFSFSPTTVSLQGLQLLFEAAKQRLTLTHSP